MILYRPTGLTELRLVAAAGWTAWPPRLPEQPILYPVLSLEYARKIARDWNSKGALSSSIGFVTRFEVQDAFVVRYPVQVAGGRTHEELWIPTGLKEHRQLPEMSASDFYTCCKYMDWDPPADPTSPMRKLKRSQKLDSTDRGKFHLTIHGEKHFRALRK